MSKLISINQCSGRYDASSPQKDDNNSDMNGLDFEVLVPEGVEMSKEELKEYVA
jgi:hypothetical protein